MFLCVFLPITLILYNVSKNITYKNIILLVLSLAFYAWGQANMVVLLLVSILINYICGLVINNKFGTAAAKVTMVIAVVINLGLLAAFKYLPFLIGNINALFHVSVKDPGLVLPIGISFYTFQALTYIISLYRGEIKAQKSPFKLALYLSMFPQVMSGPIVRYGDIAAELTNRRTSAEDFASGAKKFVAGMCKKTLLANCTGDVASAMLGSTMSVSSAWLGILMYTFQIYFDFSGYSDMAIGVARMLGFHFKENFNYPYISKNITDFWRRWHISLSSFFRDYVYIPLGGNRYKPIRNLFIVWLLTGLWHGASWNFVLWGLFYGIVLFLEKKSYKNWLGKLPHPFCNIYSIFVIMFGWALFYYTDMPSFVNWFESAFGIGHPLYDFVSTTTLLSNLWLIILCIFAATPLPKMIFAKICGKSEVRTAVFESIAVIIGFAVSFIMIVGQTYTPFLYFKF